MLKPTKIKMAPATPAAWQQKLVKPILVAVPIRTPYDKLTTNAIRKPLGCTIYSSSAGNDPAYRHDLILAAITGLGIGVHTD